MKQIVKAIKVFLNELLILIVFSAILFVMGCILLFLRKLGVE